MYMLVSFIILVIFAMFLIWVQSNEHFDQNYPIWIYWETKPGKTKPEYIDLCLKSLHKHNDKYFKIIELDDKNVYNYLPELRRDLNNLVIAQKTDYIRVALLAKYGGIWIDADTIVMRDLLPIKHKLDEKYDYVGFGCSFNKCFNGYPKPSNGLMASLPNSVLMNNLLNNLNSKLDKKQANYNYFDLGKLLLWDEIDKLSKTGYKYYHFDSKYDGSRDINGKWINVDNHISKTPTKFIDDKSLLVVFLENNKFSGDNPKYNFFSKLSSHEILSGDYWISQLFRRSFGLPL